MPTKKDCAILEAVLFSYFLFNAYLPRLFLRFNKFFLIFDLAEEQERKRDRKEESEQIGNSLTTLYAEQLPHVWQDQNGRNIEQTLS